MYRLCLHSSCSLTQVFLRAGIPQTFNKYYFSGIQPKVTYWVTEIKQGAQGLHLTEHKLVTQIRIARSQIKLWSCKHAAQCTFPETGTEGSGSHLRLVKQWQILATQRRAIRSRGTKHHCDPAQEIDMCLHMCGYIYVCLWDICMHLYTKNVCVYVES